MYHFTGADRLRGSSVGGLAANGDLDAATAGNKGGRFRSDAAISDSARDGTATGTGATRDDRGLARGRVDTDAAGGAYGAGDTTAAEAAGGGAGSLASRQDGMAADPRLAVAGRLEPRGNADERPDGLARGGGEGSITAGADVRGPQDPVEGLGRGAAGNSLDGVRQQDRGSERASTDEKVRSLQRALVVALATPASHPEHCASAIS